MNGNCWMDYWKFNSCLCCGWWAKLPHPVWSLLKIQFNKLIDECVTGCFILLWCGSFIWWYLWKWCLFVHGVDEKIGGFSSWNMDNLCIVLAHSGVVVFTTASVIFILIPVGVVIGVVWSIIVRRAQFFYVYWVSQLITHYGPLTFLFLAVMKGVMNSNEIWILFRMWKLLSSSMNSSTPTWELDIK